MLVIDTSIIIDSLYEKNEGRNAKATKFLGSIEGLTIYVPRILLIELTAVTRRLGIDISRGDIEELVADFEVLSEDLLFDEALKVAEKAHPRAVDSYFIAASKLTDSLLVSSDRRIVDNGRTYGIQACYLLEEFDDALRAVEKMKVAGSDFDS